MEEITCTELLPPLSEWADNDLLREQFRLFADGTMKDILDLVDVPLLVLNRFRQAVFINEKLQRILSDRPLSELLGNRPGDLFGCIRATETAGGCGTSETCALCGARESILMGLTGREASMECRILSANPDGITAHDLYVTTKPLLRGNDRFAMVTLLDISDQKRRRALERIFFHDVLNTAGSLSGLVEIAAERSGVELQEEFGLFKLSVRQILEEIQAQKLLMDAECRELKVKSCRLESKRILEELHSVYGFHNVAHNRRVDIDANAAGIDFTSDPVLIRRVLGNMVKNALEAVREGESVRLNCSKNNGGPLFSVSNPGVIDKKIKNQIFMRHFSTKGADRGLGTYSIKLLGENYLQGKVWFESGAESGTTFYLWLPGLEEPVN